MQVALQQRSYSNSRIAVEELKSCDQSMDMQEVIWFPHDGNLAQRPEALLQPMCNSIGDGLRWKPQASCEKPNRTRTIFAWNQHTAFRV